MSTGPWPPAMPGTSCTHLAQVPLAYQEGRLAHNAWDQASGYQCLRLLKFLGVAQQRIAAHLGVTAQNVSMWMHQARSTPAKYTAALRAYTGAMMAQAATRLANDSATLPEPLRTAQAQEFAARVRHWELESQHEQGMLMRVVQAECQQIGAFATKPMLTADDRQALQRLCQRVRVRVRRLDALEQDREAHGH